jgi:predicted PurR-regulated permease PerM
LAPATRALELSVRQKANTWFLFALAALALYLSYLLAQPFLNAIFAAVVLAIVFHPLHARMIHISARRPNLAATMTTVLVSSWSRFQPSSLELWSPESSVLCTGC